MSIRTGIVLLASALAFTSWAGAQSQADHGESALPVSLHLPFKLQGSGSPTVVFEAGAGEKLDTWDPVQFEVSKFTRTYAYTRRGYTGALMTGHRDATTIVEELRADLRDRQIAPPYVLVGHSIGGLYVQLFAKTHPEEIAGVVLVDTTHPDQFDRMKAERRGNYLLAQVGMTLSGLNAAGAEIRGMKESQEEWHAAGPFPAVPAIVLSATRDTGINSHEFTAFIQGLHRELVDEWPGAELRMVDSNHFVQKNRPQDVVKAVKDVLQRAAAARPASH